MDILQLKERKKASGLTNREIAGLSGIPFSTVNKIFSGATKNPRYSTLLAIEQVIAKKEKIPFTYDEARKMPVMVREEASAYRYAARTYNQEDIEKLEEGVRAELIAGYLYILAAPGRMHQYILTELLFQIKLHILRQNGTCQVYPAPFDVRLFGDDRTIVQPDLSVVCKKEQLTDKGCSGAPDWVIEITSEHNAKHDFVVKMMQYQKAGVREYWIVDQFEEKVYVYCFENGEHSGVYSFTEEIPGYVMDGIRIRIRTDDNTDMVTEAEK
ncbi:MAG: Uma2 family endonuclease [Eubacterium sp.]|nr:Uma2 family endonuclease [Eubacterium sp.]